MRESWRPNKDCNILTPLLWPSSLGLSHSLDAQQEARGLSLLLSAGFVYHILSPTGLRNYWGSRGPLRPGVAFPTTSYQKLLWSPTHQVPKAPSAGISLPHLISNFSGPQLSDFLSWLSYIIVRRPLNRPLNPWNGMFDRHQAEINVMQFRGHSLPVHQSMSVSWDFYLVLFRQPNPPTRSLSITGHWNVSLPSGASLWNDRFGRVEGQNPTMKLQEICMTNQLIGLRLFDITPIPVRA